MLCLARPYCQEPLSVHCTCPMVSHSSDEICGKSESKNKFLFISDLTYILFPYILNTYKYIPNNKHIEWLLVTMPALKQPNPKISETKFSAATQNKVTEV